jgi:hypothetical protein
MRFDDLEAMDASEDLLTDAFGRCSTCRKADAFDDLGAGDEFTGSFRIRTRLPQTRVFPVTSGSVSVTSSPRWDRPSACPVRSYRMTLWRKTAFFLPDENEGSRTFPIPGTATDTWTGLAPDSYYLEINVGNSNPSCILLGDITVT